MATEVAGPESRGRGTETAVPDRLRLPPQAVELGVLGGLRHGVPEPRARER